jgi:cytochrome c5
MTTARSRAALRMAALAILGAAIAACGGGGSDDGYSAPPPPAPAPNPNPGGGNANLQPTFASIQAQVFTPICTQCHSGATAPEGLRLDAASSYGLLVDIASSQQPGVQRVAPGNPGSSYLIQKLEGTAASGGRMPLNLTPLPQADINVIRQWITDGAQSTAAASTAPIRVTSTAPLPSSSATVLPASIVAIFDRPPDSSTVNATTFIVERSGGDGTFADGNEVAIAAASIAVPTTNASAAVFDTTGAPAVDDTYRVRLSGGSSGGVLDLAGNALDGEFGGAFPSGDAAQGGDFSATFTVAAAAPTLQEIQASVFTPICSGCHTGPTSGALPSGMNLSSAAASYASLVGVASVEVPATQRVQAGNPDASFLIQKLEQASPPGGGARMPFGQAPLGAPTIGMIREWIAAGAKP